MDNILPTLYNTFNDRGFDTIYDMYQFFMASIKHLYENELYYNGISYDRTWIDYRYELSLKAYSPYVKVYYTYCNLNKYICEGLIRKWESFIKGIDIEKIVNGIDTNDDNLFNFKLYGQCTKL
jgi:hypothetical protein